MRIGLFGGTFDPVHNAHIKIAEHTIKEFGLEEVWFLADKIPRRKTNVTDYRHRLQMLKEATRHNPKLITEIQDYPQTSSNYDSAFFKHVTDKYKTHEFYLIIGADSAKYLMYWDNIEDYILKAKFIIINRNNELLDDFPKSLNYQIANLENLDISSTAIRNNLSANINNLDGLVYRYILDKKLY